jgi:hypothetical protein
LHRSFEAELAKQPPPTTRLKAGTTLFRFVDPKLEIPASGSIKRMPEWPDLVSLHPNGSGLPTNRFSGIRPDGSPGHSGSYWGNTHGVASEDFFYSCMNGYDPKAGPLRLLPPMTALVVQGAQTQLPYHAEIGAPPQLSFSGSCHTNILMARTIRDIELVNFSIVSPEFLEWDHAVSRRLRSYLDELGFDDMSTAISDPEFKDLARALGHMAFLDSKTGISSLSVRRDQLSTEGYDPELANIVTFVGRNRQMLDGELNLTGVIQIRSEEHTEATLKPIGEVYPNIEDRRLALYNASPSSLILAGASEVSDSTESKGSEEE